MEAEFFAKVLEQSGIVVILAILLYVVYRAYDRSINARIASLEKAAEECQKDRIRLSARIDELSKREDDLIDRLFERQAE